MMKYRDLHVGLAAAAAMTYNQLVPSHRSRPYDVEHLSEVLNLVAQAIAKVAVLHVDDGGTRRALTEEELEGVQVRRGATLVVLRNGRYCRNVTVTRGELTDAVAILRATGLKAFASPARVSEPAGSRPEALPLKP